MVKAVIFDLDNTLYDYDRCNAIAEDILYRTIAENMAVSYERAHDLVKKAKENVKGRLGAKVASSHNRLLYMQDICERLGKNPFKYAMFFYNAYWDTMLRVMSAYDYVDPFMDGLKDKGIKVGVLTDLTVHIQYRKILTLGLAEKIDYLVTSEEAGAEKPSDKMFKLMLNKLNVLPEEALMIGDSQLKDVDGALSIGMRAVKFERGMNVYERTSALLG